MVGDTKMSVLSLDHLGWMICDGRTLNVSDWPILFDVIGYNFGSNGSTTFKLPNGQGRVPGFINPAPTETAEIPVDASENELEPRAPGDLVGTEIHQLVVSELPVHNHGTQTAAENPVSQYELTSNSTTGITTNTNAPTVGLAQRTGANTITSSDSSPGELDLVNAAQLTLTDPGHNHTLSPRGEDVPHNNMQPTIFLGNLFIYTGRPFYGANPFQLDLPLRVGSGSNIY